MYAVIETGGKQYKVAKNQEVIIEKLAVNEGDKVEFDRVLLVADGADVKLGKPVVEGAKVAAEVVEHGRGKKVSIIKFKRRKNYLRRKGHRQHFTKVKITDIKG